MGRLADLSRKEKLVAAALAAAMAGAVIHGFVRLFLKGVFSWHISTPEYRFMICEMAALFLALTVIGRYGKGKFRLAAMAAVYAGFLWIHTILLPLLTAGLYLFYICLAGRWIRRFLAGRLIRRAPTGSQGILSVSEQAGAGRDFSDKPDTGDRLPAALDAGRDFLVGSAGIICLFCLMSAVGAGSISQMWMAVLVSGGMLLAVEAVSLKRRSGPGKGFRWGFLPAAEGMDLPWSREIVFAAAFILVMFFLQAARMNIGIDYDSLWYGCRAPYILNNGQGIYENLGTVGGVYVYSKGWETLTLPLSVLPSYSFLISFNLWMAAGVVWAAYKIACFYMNRRLALFSAVFLSAVPAVMNMGITAKTDLATLLVQLLMILEIVNALSGCREKGLSLYYGLSAFLLSWTMKPTAMVFSSAVGGMSFLYLLVTGNLALKVPRKDRMQAAGAVTLAVGALTGIWARTWLITGLPVTSVFSSLLTKIGFRMKYPFSIREIPNSAAGKGFWEQARFLAGRLYGLVLNPESQDMSHVIIAWGGLTIWFVLGLWISWLFLEKKERDQAEKRLDGWLLTVLLPYAAVNLISLYLLLQVDGNYFILLYVLLILMGFRLLARLQSGKARKLLMWAGLPVMAFSVLLSTVTNWSWTLGFSPVDVINRGYYNHEEAWHGKLAAAGNETIWNILAQNPRNRVISIGSHPETLMFPCSVQSYTDITGSDGNVVLAKTMDNFVEFMRYAGTDYVYAEAWWINQNERSWSLTCNLIEYGILRPICYENGHMLAEVDTEGQRTEESEALLAEFQERYASSF